MGDDVVVIHNDNVPLYEKSYQTIRFDINSSDVDGYISNTILPIIKDKNPKFICIKDNLSTNYVDLLGVRLAYHIRLSEELEEIRFVPILILSDLDAYLLNKIDKLSKILFSKKIFITSNHQRQIEDMLSRNIKPLTENEYRDNFLTTIHVEQPKDYLSHHQITNEWAIYQWAKMLGVESKSINKNKTLISSMLYFKYILAKSGIETESKDRVVKELNTTGKVLFIDDRWQEGWRDVIEAYISQRFPNIEKCTFEYDYKDKKIDELKEAVKEKFEEFDADTVILDLRLLSSDDAQKEVENISGFKLIDTIHEINPAIQIVMFTASHDSTILDELNSKNILGYVKKNAPNERYETETKSFHKLGKLIKIAMQRKYLKEIWSIQEELLGFSIFKNREYYAIKSDIETVYKILESDIEKKFVYAMFAMYRVMEGIRDIYIDDKSIKYKDNSCEISAIFKIDDRYKKIEKEEFIKNHERYGFKMEKHASNYYTSTTNRIRAILYEKLSIDNSELLDTIDTISRKRNNEIHVKNDKKLKVHKRDMLSWFSMLKSVFKRIEELSTSIA